MYCPPGPGRRSLDAVGRGGAEARRDRVRAAVSGGDADWDLRWFTPTIEVDLCGHATLATTHALLADGLVGGKVGFSTRSGVLTASVDDGWITLDFPVNRPVEAAAPAGLIAALGAEPVGVCTARAR